MEELKHHTDLNLISLRRQFFGPEFALTEHKTETDFPKRKRIRKETSLSLNNSRVTWNISVLPE